MRAEACMGHEWLLMACYDDLGDIRFLMGNWPPRAHSEPWWSFGLSMGILLAFFPFLGKQRKKYESKKTHWKCKKTSICLFLHFYLLSFSLGSKQWNMNAKLFEKHVCTFSASVLFIHSDTQFCCGVLTMKWPFMPHLHILPKMDHSCILHHCLFGERWYFPCLVFKMRVPLKENSKHTILVLHRIHPNFPGKIINKSYRIMPTSNGWSLGRSPHIWVHIIPNTLGIMNCSAIPYSSLLSQITMLTKIKFASLYAFQQKLLCKNLQRLFTNMS